MDTCDTASQEKWFLGLAFHLDLGASQADANLMMPICIQVYIRTYMMILMTVASVV